MKSFEKPGDLTIEWIRDTDTVFVIDDRPEYGWVVPDVAIIQSGYQLLVASTEEKLDKNIGDIWDSGQIHSSSPLHNNETYYWKVRIWHKDNQPSPYSKVQRFRMGIPMQALQLQIVFKSRKLNL